MLGRLWSRLRRAPAPPQEPALTHAPEAPTAERSHSATPSASYRTWAVELDVVRGDGRAPVRIEGRVTAPTVGQALAALGAGASAALDLPLVAIPGVTSPDVDFRLVREIARDWLPPEMADDVLALSDVPLARLLASVVAATAEIPARRPSGDGTGAALSWDRVVIEVARAYGWTVTETRAMEWPDFVAAAAAVPSLRAADTLRAAEAALAPHMGADGLRSMFDRLESQARGEDVAETPAVAPAWEQAGQTQDEYRAAQRERAAAARRGMVEVAAQRAASAAGSNSAGSQT